MPTAAAPRSTKISAKPAAKPEYDPEAIRERLSAVCEGYTLHRLQDLTGCFHETIRRQMNGQNKPSIQFLARIATCFGVSLDWLVLGVGEREARRSRLDDGGVRRTADNSGKVRHRDRLQQARSIPAQAGLASNQTAKCLSNANRYPKWGV
jgi:transcriptional regulator with XRE-family HTH domain